MRRLDVVVGPNGAGKSTFVERTLVPSLPPGVPFVNADLIAARRWLDEAEARSYEAARIADRTRLALIESGTSFVAETVFSHPSKLELIAQATDAGFDVFLHAVMVPVDLSVLRVVYRKAAGGHSVPEDKVRSRYDRLWPLVVMAARDAHVATFYDNSSIAGPRIVARVAAGRSTGVVRWPAWSPDELGVAWPATR